MLCPKCYGKVDKNTNRCNRCGFNLNDLKNASNLKAKEKFRSKDADLVIYSKVLPKDVSKKKLLLFSGLLGLFGAHYFYIGRFWRGLFNLISTIFNSVFFVFYMLNYTGNEVFKYFEYFSGLLFAIVFLLSAFDFINIIFNKFKVPVYIVER